MHDKTFRESRKVMSKLPALVEVLLKPETYAHHPRKVELVQTQMSFIFLTGDYVYKVKKPVDLGYLDYTTLEKRLFFCRQEVELNRRLCPDVYLEVVPLVSHNGKIRLGGEGEAIEYAVKMKQLPADRMMDRLLTHDLVTEEMVDRVARKLAAFHANALTDEEISKYGSLEAIMINTDENFDQTEKYIDITVPSHEYNRIKAYTEHFLESNKSLLVRRVKEGRVKDCHGDLHAAHVCISNGICIYDCIEFNDRFRYGDVASEVAFLAMDLDRFQRADLSGAFVNAYVRTSQDEELLKLLNFYKCYRAYVRAKVSSFMFDDPYIPDKEATRTAARSYFDLAYRYTRERPLLLIMAGLVGTGKTTVVEALSRSLGMNVISSDVVRKGLAGIPSTERRFEPFSAGIYSEEFSKKTYDEMFARAGELLSKGQSVILDASFKKRQDRLQAKKLADEANADFSVIECILDRDAVKKRLERRVKEGSVSDGRWEIYEQQKQDFDEITEFPPEQHIVLDTSQPMSNIVKIVSEKIYG
jgi:aminoglycoside phosphotransferase family enzyme/predicted kinase